MTAIREPRVSGEVGVGSVMGAFPSSWGRAWLRNGAGMRVLEGIYATATEMDARMADSVDEKVTDFAGADCWLHALIYTFWTRLPGLPAGQRRADLPARTIRSGDSP